MNTIQYDDVNDRDISLLKKKSLLLCLNILRDYYY